MPQVSKIVPDFNVRYVNAIKNILVVIVLAIVFLLDLYPKLWRISELSSQVSGMQTAKTVSTSDQKREDQLQLVSEWQQVTNQVEFIKRRKQELHDRVKADKDMAEISMEIEDLASPTKLEVVSIKPGVAFKLGEEQVLPVEVGFRCEYSQLVDFLARTASSKFLVATRKIVIKKAESGDARLEGQVLLNFLFSEIDVQGKGRPVQGIGQ